MNRVKRDYCSKNNHPNWKAWTAKYDMKQINWPWIGNFCTFCNQKVHGKASGIPAKRYLP